MIIDTSQSIVCEHGLFLCFFTVFYCVRTQWLVSCILSLLKLFVFSPELRRDVYEVVFYVFFIYPLVCSRLAQAS